MDLEVRLLTPADIQSMKKEWRQEAENSENYFPTDVDRIVCMTESASGMHGIFEKGSGSVLAVIELISSPTSKDMVKLLRCDLRPALDDVMISSKVESDEYHMLMDVFLESISYTLKEGAGRQTIKLYGRQQLLRDLLIVIHQKIKDSENFSSKIKSKLEARWLVLEKA